MDRDGLCQRLDGEPPLQDDSGSPDWPALVEGCSIEDLAATVLQRLNPAGERLLLMEYADVLQVCYRLQDAAAEDLGSLDLPEGERRTLRQSALLLSEIVFEGQGRLALAAALYALGHDEKSPGEDDATRFERTVLRFKLGHVLSCMGTPQTREWRAAVEILQSASRLAKGLQPSLAVPEEALRELRSVIQTRLGTCHEDQGEPKVAAETFLQAIRSADSVDDRVGYTARAAWALAESGSPQEAYRLLKTEEGRLAQVEDELDQSLWEIVREDLRDRLGANPWSRREHPDLESFGEVRRLLLESWRKDRPPEPGELQGAISELKALERKLREDPSDADLLRRVLTDLAHLAAAEQEMERAEALLSEAEGLEARLRNPDPTLRRRLTRARIQLRTADRAKALEDLLGIFEESRLALDPGDRLEIAGHVLEALSLNEAEPLRILSIVSEVSVLFREVAIAQATAPARRRIRDLHQRPLETALLALCSAAARVGPESDVGQELLATAWSFLAAIRSPELFGAAGRARSGDSRLREMEGRFHRALRDHLVGNVDPKHPTWPARLEDLLEHELGLLEKPAVSAEEEAGAPDAALAFFQIRDLLRDRLLLVLARVGGVLRFRCIPRAEEVILEPWLRWGQWMAALARGVRLLPDSSHSEERLPAIQSLLPPGIDDAAGSSAPLAWSLLPDGRFHSLPFEILPDSRSEERRFGQGRAVRISLRSGPFPRADTRVRFFRGWLGLGGVPRAGDFEELPGSRREVEQLSRFLQGAGYRAEALIGREGHAEHLRRKIAEIRPAVLHLAVHGSTDSEHPEACTLILADCPGSPEGELLPFRRVRDLDLSGVDLVVLSACSSLLGRSTRSVGMEGLAWAFLEAGAAQVVASRYQVGDEATEKLMLAFYRHLQSHPVAEALGHTRDEALRSLRLPLCDVGAWSVWS